MRRRLDAEMVRRGLSPDRDAAGDLIRSGRVLVHGAPAETVGRLVDAGEPVTVVAPAARFVGRGGDKLDAALDRFGLDVTGVNALDAGASTGGFTDCLLQRGARHVVALDVGHNQLHEQSRRDPRVTSLERTNLRHVDASRLGTFDAVVADLSFISLDRVMDRLVGACRQGGWIVVLAKPQFEVDRAVADVGRGVITDPVHWRDALQRVSASALDSGATVVGAMVSPLRGATGNTEFLLHLRPAVASPSSRSVADLIGEAIDEASAR
ncbi:MAG: TlyA family RNA methyltransferase [Acidimicrobiales bacterium]